MIALRNSRKPLANGIEVGFGIPALAQMVVMLCLKAAITVNGILKC
jgi:hypothetical protein